MTLRKDGRRLIQLTMKPEFYDRIQEHCAAADVPATVWVRELIKKELARVGAIPPL